MKISELMDGIRKSDVVLPEFQREYVWTREQAKQLLVSLVKGYPVGSLLVWKTDQPPDLKNLEAAPEKLGTLQVTLDGQQRLTTLYMFITGQIPPYYTERDIVTDPRNLYYNLDNGDFQYYQASRMKGSPVWWRVVDCFDPKRIKIFEIARRAMSSASERSTASWITACRLAVAPVSDTLQSCGTGSNDCQCFRLSQPALQRGSGR